MMGIKLQNYQLMNVDKKGEMDMRHGFKGNRWYKCDFHLHTPASECFDEPNITPEDFINKVKSKGLECIAITDHNTASWIDKIREVANKESITVFPGVEITCSDSKVHLLILFDTKIDIVYIEDFIRDIGIKREEFGKKTAHSNKSVIEVAIKAKEVGAIVIPAHVDCFSGLSEVSYATQVEFLNLDNINALQMVNKDLIIKDVNTINSDEFYNLLNEEYGKISKEDVSKYINCAKIIKEKNKGILTFSDNPSKQGSSKHGLWGIGKEYSFIKMGENPTLEGLRQAFLFPQIRIKNCFEIDSKEELLPEMWISKVIIKDTELCPESPLEVDFNPHLTTIIGGRGTGKSTIIRFLTGILKEELINGKDEVSHELKRFYSINNGDVGVLRKTTEVIIEIIKNNNKYRIIAKNFENDGKNEKSIEKYNTTKEVYETIEDISINDMFSVDIYNQKQIYNLSRNPNSLREKIDSLIENINEPKLRIKKYMSEYKAKYAFIKQLEVEVSMKKKISLEINDLKEKIDLYRESGINEILKKYEIFNIQKKVVNDYIKGIDENIESISKFYGDFNLKIGNIEKIDENFRCEIEKITNSYNKDFFACKNEIQKITDRLKNIKNKFIEDINESNWYKEYEIVSNEYTKTLESLSENGIDVKIINELLEKQKNKQEEIDRLSKIEIVLKDEYSELEKLRINYVKAREEIFNLRKNEVQGLLSDTNIKVQFKKFRDYNNFIDEFRKIIQRANKFDLDINKIADNCFDGNIQENIKSLVKDIIKIKDSKENNNNFSKKFNSVLKDLNDEQIATLNLFLPEDDIQIQYKANMSSTYKSLTNASAGQKTSAMLTFILSDGITPLILDQPEDDLDNHLIYDLVVERLRVCKDKRQIIVVTHNANIPVNGDSELVVTMNSESKDVEIFTSGTIEEKLVKEEICNVMEGGEKAFRMRANRYSLS